MISDAQRKQNVKDLKAHLSGGHLKVLGYNIDGKGNSGIFTECLKCGKVSKRSLTYWKRYPNCYCQRAANIAVTKLAATDVKAICKAANVKFLTPYTGMNTKSTVECLKCGNCWEAWPGNLVKGHSCAECAREDLKKRNLKKYGVAFAVQRPSIQKKIRQTMLRKYGVEHALQNKELHDKNLKTAFKHKVYKLGTRKVKVQGYEPQALDFILANYPVSPSDIVCGVGSAVPSVKYTFKGKTYVYHPDIYIKSLNRLVEVKGEYTYTASLKRNLAKRDACLAAGYKFSFFIMDGHGNRISEKDCRNRR